MPEKMTYEQSLNRLDEIADALESGEAGLDASLELYAEASKLISFCNKKLCAAQSKIVKLMAPEQSLVPQDFSAGNEEI